MYRDTSSVDYALPYVPPVCIWRMFVFMSVVVTVWGSVGMFVV